jgi:hypothetical protein
MVFEAHLWDNVPYAPMICRLAAAMVSTPKFDIHCWKLISTGGNQNFQLFNSG